MWTELTIKNLRKALNMTQEEFSKFTKIPKRTIENWENGVRKPPKYIIDLLKEKITTELKIRNCKNCMTNLKNTCTVRPIAILQNNYCPFFDEINYEYAEIDDDEYDKIEAYPITNEPWITF